MKLTKRLAMWLGVVLVPLVQPLEGQSRLTENTLRLDDGTSRQRVTFDDLSWLVGSWSGEGLGGTHREVWFPAEAGTMTGVFKLIVDERVAVYEILWIVPDGPSLAMKLRHFGQDLTPWEDPGETVTFPLIRAEAEALYFDRLTFRKTSADRIDVFLVVGQDQEEQHLVYRRTELRG